MRLDKIIKYGKKHSFSIVDISELIHVNKNTATKYIRDLKKANEIYIYDYKRTGGSMSILYKTGNKPDAIKPKPMTRYEYDRRWKDQVAIQRAKEREQKPVITQVVIKRDIAAAWIN